MESLFGELAVRFGPSPENLATEALGYVLSRSPAAAEGFRRVLDGFGRPVPWPLRFRTQAADDAGAIPDLVGRDDADAERVLVEAKFWAGLTPRQPTAYLDRLPAADGLLVFLVPSRRAEAVWPELLRRCEAAGRPADRTDGAGPDGRVAWLRDGRRLGLTSWRAVLDGLQAEAVRAGESGPAADLAQLRGLTDRMDSDRFLPFTGEELTSATGTRVLQLCDLIDRVADRLVAEEDVAWTTGRSSGGRSGTYFSAPFAARGVRCRLYFSPVWWAERGHPLGVECRAGPAGGRAIADAFRPFAARHPRRFAAEDWGAWAALEVPTGVELDDVVTNLVRQCRELFALLGGVGGGPAPAAGDGPDGPPPE